MSENKYTPEPWRISDHNKSIIKCYQGEQTPHGTTPYFAGGGALESERTANARRVVACVNRLAQFTTEQIEDFGYDLFAEDRPRLAEAQNEIHLLKKQRDELLLSANKCRLDLLHQIHELADHIERANYCIGDQDMLKQINGQSQYAMEVASKWNQNGNPFESIARVKGEQ